MRGGRDAHFFRMGAWFVVKEKGPRATVQEYEPEKDAMRARFRLAVLAAAIAAYKEAIFYLETVNPKPEGAAEALEGVRRASAELDKRYADQRFRADKALNLSQWETARNELLVILEMVPDRRDDRNRDARSKLLSAEGYLKKKGGR